jgi:LuxR family transcriptional regulator, maltose regulon positive regulatory protein
MDNQLLTIKFYPPHVHQAMVLRPRLIQRINEGMRRKLTLLSAPAGFGKTSLIGQWVTVSASKDRAVAWLSLDEGDSDPMRFWTYLLTAIDTATGGAISNSLELLRSPRPPSIEAILTSLINNVASINKDFALVLDDYHLVNNPVVHHDLAFLLEHLPAQMHLIIATRTDPPLPLAHLRAGGQLVELRSPDLRFTSEEASQFLNDMMILGLSAEDVAVLEQSTEGWIAGLQLATLLVEGREDSSKIIADFTGENRYIVDYLAQEVLTRQSEEVQDFLLQTSLLDRLSGPLCDAVTSGRDGQRVLEKLEEGNLFLLPLDDKRRWYRYHHLFSEFLRQQLYKQRSALAPDLHRRASHWYEDNGLVEDAIGHALAAEDFSTAARLVEDNSADRLMRREIATLLGWVEALPDELVLTRPRLCLAYAFALFENGRMEETGRYLQTVERALSANEGGTTANSLAQGDPDTQAVLGRVAALRSFIACYQGDVSDALELSYRALELLPSGELHLRSGIAANIAGNLGMTYGSASDIREAVQTMSEAARKSESRGNKSGAIVSLCLLAELEVRRGRLQKAARAYKRALQLGATPGKTPLMGVAIAYVGMGEILVEWNDLNAARQHLTKGIALAERNGDLGTMTLGYVNQARLLCAESDFDGALEVLRKAEQAIGSTNVAWANGQIAAARAQVWLLQGNLEPAGRWAQNYSLAMVEELGYRRDLEYTMLGRVYIAQGNLDEALLFLDKLLSVAERGELNGIVIEVLALKALALNLQGDTEEVTDLLRRALSLAEPEGYIHLFIDKGAPMMDLLRYARSRGISINYLGRLLEASEQVSVPPSAEFQTSPEFLGERELEVLCLIAAGMSNRRIAEELVIGQGTVKTHINNIYRKLDVQSRTQALARARELNLI